MGLSETLKRSLVAGIALLAPLLVTVVAIRLIFGWLRGLLDPIIQGTGLISLTGNIEIAAEVGALLILLLGIAIMGYLTQRSAGAYVFGALDRLVGVIPIVSVVYNGVRQVSDALTKQDSRYKSVALVEYPREGVYSFAFITAETPERVAEPTGTDTFNVYLPGSPNPTQGRLILVPEDQLYELDINVSRAIRLLVTTGIAENEEEMQQLHEEVRAELAEEDIDIEDAL